MIQFDKSIFRQYAKKLDVPVVDLIMQKIKSPQAIACYRALKDGINPDDPEGLTAWVKI